MKEKYSCSILDIARKDNTTLSNVIGGHVDIALRVVTSENKKKSLEQKYTFDVLTERPQTRYFTEYERTEQQNTCNDRPGTMTLVCPQASITLFKCQKQNMSNMQAYFPPKKRQKTKIIPPYPKIKVVKNYPPGRNKAELLAACCRNTKRSDK